MSNLKKDIKQLDDFLGNKSKLNPKKSVELLNRISKSLELQKTNDDENNKEIQKRLDNLYKIKEYIAKQSDDSKNVVKVLLELKKILDKVVDKNLDDESTLQTIITLLSKFELPTEIEVSNFPSSINVDNFPEKVEISNLVKEIKVSNFPTNIKVSNFPTEIKVSNQPTEIKVNNFPKVIEIKKPKWYKQFDPTDFVSDIKDFFTKSFDNIVKKITNAEYKANIDKYKNEKHALAVKIVDKDGQLIKDLFPKVVVSGGGGGGIDPVGLKDSSNVRINPATEDKQNLIITAINNVSGLQRATNMEGKGKNAIGIVATEIVFTGITEVIHISADINNTGTLYWGKSDVATDGSNAMGFLEAGESIQFDYDDTTNAVYVVASVAAQNYWAGALF